MSLGGSLNRLILDLVFPRRCLGCGRHGMWICKACSANIQCAPAERDLTGTPVISLLAFEEKMVRESLHALKYNGLRDVAGELAQVVLAEAAPILEGAVLVPVPISPSRRKTRGYNQAEELARALGENLGLPVWSTALKRLGRSSSQVGKGAGERQAVEKGFAWEGRGESAYAGRPWVLIDDLVTTGATLAACLDILRPHATAGLRAFALASKS